MIKDLITLQVHAKVQSGEQISKVFISESDFDKTRELGYPIEIVENREFFVPTSSKLYEHHYEVKSFSFPKNAQVVVNQTPFVYNAQPTKSKIKVR